MRARRSGRRGQNHHFEGAAPHERRAEFDAVWTDSIAALARAALQRLGRPGS
jgi:hypothetical protein